MDDTLLGGLVDYANGLRDERSSIISLLLGCHPRFLYECLDPGLGCKVAQAILARLLDVLHDRFNIRQLRVTPSSVYLIR